MFSLATSTLPTETAITEADFSGDTLASLLAIARDYDAEHFDAKNTVEAGVRNLLAAGWQVACPVLDNPGDLHTCPLMVGLDGRPTSWRVGGRDELRCFRTVCVQAVHPDGRAATVAVTQKVWRKAGKLGGRTVGVQTIWDAAV